jgi:hypothetical protein
VCSHEIPRILPGFETGFFNDLEKFTIDFELTYGQETG